MGPDSGAQGSGVQQRPEQKTFLLAPSQEGAAGTSLGSRGLRLHASGSGGLGWGGSLAGKRRPCMPLSAANKKKRGLDKRGSVGNQSRQQGTPSEEPSSSKLNSATYAPRVDKCLPSTCCVRAAR